MTGRQSLNWPTILFIAGTSLAALAWPVYAFFFGTSAGELALAVAYFVATGLGITVGYHRLITHRSFRCRPWVEAVFLVVGAAAWQGSALDWATDHARHHAHTDTDLDPYDIRQGFWHAHMGWLLTYDSEGTDVPAFLSQDRLVMWQHRYYLPVAITISFIVPLLVCGIGGLLLAGAVRLVALHHSTWFINSWAHLGGHRPYDPATSANDNWVVAFFTFGEGFHNYHHSFPTDYRNGISPFAFDPSKWLIAALSFLRVAWGLERVGAVSRWRLRVRNVIAWVGDELERAEALRALRLALERQRLRTGAKLARKARKLTKIGLPPHATRAQLMVWLSENAEECKVELTARYRRRFHRLSELAGNMRVYDRLLDKVGQYEERLALGTAWAPTGA
ncbi:MAG: fatty acid desaturase [Deltaproteobacteria bacterium]